MIELRCSERNCSDLDWTSGAVSFNSSNQYLSHFALSIRAQSSITVSYWEYQGTANVQNSSAFNIAGPSRIQAHSPWSDRNLYWDYGDGRVSTDFTSYLDAWTHVTLEYDASAKILSLYLNG